MIYRMISQLSSMRILTKNKRVLQILKHALNILLSNKKHQLVYNHPFNMSNYLLQHTCGVNPVLPNNASFILFLLVSHATPDSLRLDNWGTWHRCQLWDSIIEWRNLVTGEKIHWLQVGLEPSSLQIACPCCQRAKPLHHLALCKIQSHVTGS